MKEERAGGGREEEKEGRERDLYYVPGIQAFKYVISLIFAKLWNRYTVSLGTNA